MSLGGVLDAFESLPAFARVVATLPRPGERRPLAGLAGSSDAVLAAALSRRLPHRLIAVVTDSVADAERWLADLQVVLDEPQAALYPPREGFGEVEPHAEIAGERVETLERLSRGAVRILLTTGRALMERTHLPKALLSGRLELRKGDERRPEDLATHLEGIGFERVPMVDDVAQFSVRGGIVDIYGFGMAEPVRLEYWGDEIIELRHFDLLTQRSTRDAEVALILPVDVAPSGDTAVERRALAELWPPDTLVLLPDESHLDPELGRTWEEAAHHIELARRRGEDAPSRAVLFQPPDEALRRLRSFARLSMADPAREPEAIVFPVRPPETISRDVKLLRRIVRDGTPTIILCDNAGQAERLEELLNEGEWAPSPAAIVIGVLHAGFVLPPAAESRVASHESRDPSPITRHSSLGLRVLTDHEIFRRERRLRRARKYAGGIALETTTALKPGDYVVHLEHGVGIYRGIERLFVRESTIEVAVIEYEGGDRLNVPLYRLDQIERYRAALDGDESAVPPRLHKLGGRRWKQQRDRTQTAIREMTMELLQLYARRQLASRPPHVPDTAWQRQLESSFLFEDTPDQRTATTDVKRDLERPQPMDRLLVGDVGYGKTEVAVRAAFKAVQSGRQVAVLVPTTILAEQHARTFGERLADFPVRLATLSRFLTPQEQAKVVAGLADGTVDVVIGTHRLLSEDVRFSSLGLIVVDEEHRFGVKHKERLKQLRVETDVLTLTATPIPRTLHLSLAGLRDMTLMQTPPRDRSPVLTFVEPWDDGLIAEGIARELDRGGQVFFVHNRIETIVAVAEHVQRLAPRARVAVGHGQMRERELEEVMRRFVAGEVDVLVSTMIVESGLDVPNANTMFVNRADHFGLAQLYQLRGRVGRSHRRAFCYLLVPDAVDEDAERRLQVLEHHTELGSGYRVALKDLELRGAGNLLGPEQSGFVQAVGFDLYLRLLDETVHRVRAGEDAPRLIPADVSLDLPAYLPDDYIPSQEAKLDIYRRLTALSDTASIEELRLELRDRFGPLPDPAAHLLATSQLRVLGGELQVEGILVHGDEARITFHETAVPRLKGLQAAFHEVQFRAEVRRTHPLSLKLTRQGGSGLLEGLVRALQSMLGSPDRPSA
ncbi:MAG TPA: transcription-repair coupling factor [Gemmatimonadaceae bacterium]|nr:transcription-repair coupling factor [Gemmatimonadaceae bacterium]